MSEIPAHKEDIEDRHEDEGEEIDPADTTPLESCSAPIVTAPASEDDNSSQPPNDYDEGPVPTPSTWNPTEYLWEKEFEFPDATREEIMNRLFKQVYDLRKILLDRIKGCTWVTKEDELIHGLNNIWVMHYKLHNIDKKVPRDPDHDLKYIHKDHD